MSGPILILGASGGIGSAVAKRLSREGRAIILHGRERRRLESLAAELPHSNWVETADLADELQVKQMFERLREAHGRLDGVVFSIAVPFPNKLTHRTPWQVFEEQYVTQVKALHLCATAALPLLADCEVTTRFVVISTEFVDSPPIKTAPYSMAKAAVTTYARVIAKEWLRHGIRVHIVAPGLVRTSLVAAIPDEFLEQMAANMPEKCLTAAEDVAAVVAFQLTDAADPLYGTSMRVSRGPRT